MRLPATIIAVFIFASLLFTGCPSDGQIPDAVAEDEPGPVFIPPEPGYPTEDVLLCTIYFYTGDNVGDRWRTTGPQMSVDKGQTWQHMAWENIITNGIAVGPYGKHLYTSCGNGVLASSDGGRNWRVTENWRMTEIQDVAISPGNPLVVWAAGAYGLFLSFDGGVSWNRPGDPQPFRYVDNVLIDRNNGWHVLIGTEEGLYVTRNRGETYEKVDPDVPVRAMMQDSRNPDHYWIGTDGDGLWKSIDGGENFTRTDGPGAVINRIIQSVENPEKIICGLRHGVGISLDDGVSWDMYTDGFGEFSPVYALQIDKDDPDLIYAGARDGFYVSENGGVEWSEYIDKNGDTVLENAVIIDLWQGELYRGDEEPPSDAPGTLMANETPSAGLEYRDNYVEGFDERATAAGVAMADKGDVRLANLAEGAHIGPFQTMAMIKEGRASDELWDDQRAKFSDFGHSMFDSFPAMSLYLFCEDELPDDIKDLIRKGVTGNNIYRGDTENHWLMYYTALLLACQEWPETSPAEWYTGRTTQENYNDAVGWINEWTRITTTIGQGEFDSPHYFNTYMAPSLLLYEFAEDEDLKRQAGMVVDLLMADMTAESLEGRYCGGHSRMYDPTVVRGDYDNSTCYFFLNFGGIELPEEFHSWALAAAYSSYRCPQVIANIAWTEELPYVHTEVKRVRNQMRYSDLLNSPVYKYTYMTGDYALGSLHGGILQPIQQHTWDVTWIGSEKNTTLFSLHPYFSSYELAMFFPEDPHMLTASVQAQKGTYTNPQKLNSSSPFERTFQHENTIMVVYDIPEGTDHNHVTLYVPDCLNHRYVHNWIMGEDNGTYVAVYVVTEGEWYDEPVENFPPASRFQIPAGQTAIITEVASESEGLSFSEFIVEISMLDEPEFEKNDEGPIVSYTNRHGDSLVYSWGDDTRKLNGEVWEYASDMLYGGPFVNSIVDSRIIEITAGGVKRTLDFNTVQINEEGILGDNQ